MNKILLVGGNGYLGKNLKNSLENKYEVFYTGRDNLKSKKYYRIDFRDERTFENIKSCSFNYIFILSADFSGLGHQSLEKKYLEVNTTLYASFLEFLNKNVRFSNIVYISSMTVYSKTNKNPVSEDSCTNTPPNTYGLSKFIGERLTQYYCNKNKVNGLIFRIPGLYGGERKSGYLYNAIMKISQNSKLEINTNGLVYWECILIDDVVKMITSFLENYKWEIPFDIYNLCYGEEADIVKIAYEIKNKINSTSEIVEVTERGYSKFYLDNAKAKNVINVTCNLSDSLDLFIKQIVN